MPPASPLGSVPRTSPGGEITVTNLSKTYGAGEFAKQVVQNCSFTIDRGKLTVMIGPSGCGKSTLIRLLAGFERPSGGSAGSVGGAAGGGLGFFIWNSYVGGSYTQIVAGMISIGIAGYISSAVLRKIGQWMTPWLSGD